MMLSRLASETKALRRQSVVFSFLIAPMLNAACASDSIDFVRDVRPILQQHCYSCHAAEKQKSGLRLDIKAEAFKGGEAYGPSIVAGKVKDSPLIQFVADPNADLMMPPETDRLSDEEITTLSKWVEEGAVWPDGVDLATLEDRRDHWSFKPVESPAVPEPADDNWSRNQIDRFILAKLKDEALQPAPEADRVTWLRRVSLDLIGLPPTPDQVQAFVDDQSSDAFVHVVDDLLDSPRYGERWSQHWLDVVRYADTHGFEVNTERPNAWPYRDYVIDALNKDVPYDRFVRDQIVGDRTGQGAATGFLVTASVLLPGQIGRDAASIRLARQDSLDEIVVNISQTFLALSVGCARCHDHKFDPVSQQEYYALQAFVAGVEYEDREMHTPETNAKKSVLESEAAAANSQHVAFAGTFRTPDDIHLLLRGDPEQPMQQVAPAVLSVIGSRELPVSSTDEERRTALADWIASPENPLTARVMVNRIWQGHFGFGLVETASDFGRTGTSPSHPHLLDWLATEFIRSGWSVKHLHRLITLSATYRQSGRYDAATASKDSESRFLWRFPSRRLDAETIRDSMLFVSGRLNLKMGGPGFDLFDKRGGLTGFKPVENFSGDGLRRMIYAHKVRRERDGVFGAFDCPDNGQSTSRRRESATPIQALNLFNSQFTLDESAAFAARIQSNVGDNINQQIRNAYQLALNRHPSADEADDARPTVEQHGLATLCRVLLNSNEFLFLP